MLVDQGGSGVIKAVAAQMVGGIENLEKAVADGDIKVRPPLLLCTSLISRQVIYTHKCCVGYVFARRSQRRTESHSSCSLRWASNTPRSWGSGTACGLLTNMTVCHIQSGHMSHELILKARMRYDEKETAIEDDADIVIHDYEKLFNEVSRRSIASLSLGSFLPLLILQLLPHSSSLPLPPSLMQASPPPLSARDAGCACAISWLVHSCLGWSSSASSAFSLSRVGHSHSCCSTICL